MFTTNGHVTDYVFLLARTNPDVPNHKGLTTFLVPLDQPGVEAQAVYTLSGERTNIMFFSDGAASPTAGASARSTPAGSVLMISLQDEHSASFSPHLARILGRNKSRGASVEESRRNRRSPPMRTTMFQICLLLSILVLAGCSGNTAALLPPTAASSSPTTTLAQPTAPLGIYIGGTAGIVSALNATNGTVRWRAQLAQASTTTIVALAAGVVYVSGNDPGSSPSKIVFYALRASDGTVLWHQTRSGASADVALSQGTVYLTFGGDGNTSFPPHEIEALHAQDGSVLWHTQLEGTGPSAVRVASGVLYVTSFSSLVKSPGYFYAATHLYALNASTGTVQWHRQLSRTNVIAAVTTGQVYLVDTGTDVVCEPRVLHVLDSSSGAEQWQREGRFLEFLGVEQERAYVEAAPDGCAAPRPFEHGVLSTLHTVGGTGVWQSTIPFGSGAVASNGVLYVPAEDGDLTAYSAGNGVELWRAPGEGGWLDLFDGVLYTSLEGRGLDALSTTTGAVEWRYPTPDGVAVSGVAHGLLYGVLSHINSQSGVEDSALVALRAGTGELLWRVEIGILEGTPLVG